MLSDKWARGCGGFATFFTEWWRRGQKRLWVWAEHRYQISYA